MTTATKPAPRASGAEPPPSREGRGGTEYGGAGRAGKTHRTTPHTVPLYNEAQLQSRSTQSREFTSTKQKKQSKVDLIVNG
jgi:hypothetical protein